MRVVGVGRSARGVGVDVADADRAAADMDERATVADDHPQVGVFRIAAVAEQLHRADGVRGADFESPVLVIAGCVRHHHRLAVGDRDVERARGVAGAPGEILVAADSLAGREATLAVEAAQRRGREVHHLVVGAGQRIDRRAQLRLELVGRGDPVRAERVEVGVAVVGHGVVAADAHLAELAEQAHRGAAIEEARRIRLRAVVDVESALEPEAGLEALAQVLDAVIADAVRVEAAAAQRLRRIVAVLRVAKACVDDAEQRRRALRLCQRAEGRAEPQQ